MSDLDRVAIVGPRDANEADVEAWLLTRLSGQRWHIVTGCANGVDAAARRFAKRMGWPLSVHEANWRELGRAAGPERNGRVVKDSDWTFALWNGKTPGTLNCIKQTIEAEHMAMVFPLAATKTPPLPTEPELEPTK